MRKIFFIVPIFVLLHIPVFTGDGFEQNKFPYLKELAITFTQMTTQKQAEALLTKLNLPFREGADSSRGKHYFYNTGPKYILHVPKDKLSEIEASLKKEKIVHEVYYPDWSKRKD